MKENKLTNLNKIPMHMRGDYLKRNENISNNKELCENCDGTGNELYSMYRKCPKCNGTGIKNVTNRI